MKKGKGKLLEVFPLLMTAWRCALTFKTVLGMYMQALNRACENSPVKVERNTCIESLA